MTTIGEISTIFDGPHATPVKKNDGPIFLSISSLERGRLDLSKSAHLSEEDFKKWTKRVIYAMDEEDQICSTELVVWRCPTENLKNFLYLIAISPQFIAHCVQSATGTSNSHKRVNPKVMMRFDLPYKKEIAEDFGARISSIVKKLIISRRENQQLAQLRDWLLPLLMNGQVTVP